MYMRESWTDDRLDDFRGEVNRRFDGVDRRLDRMDDRFERVEVRLEGLQRVMFQLGAAGIVTMVIGFLGIIITHA